jgi:hypothetical protein
VQQTSEKKQLAVVNCKAAEQMSEPGRLHLAISSASW